MAAALAVFVVYTALAGNGVQQVTPSSVVGAKGHVALVGKVVGRVTGRGQTLRFRLKDIDHRNAARVLVAYRGSVPDMFATGRDIVVGGRMRNGVFVGSPGSLVTKCPDHYAGKSSKT